LKGISHLKTDGDDLRSSRAGNEGVWLGMASRILMSFPTVIFQISLITSKFGLNTVSVFCIQNTDAGPAR